MVSCAGICYLGLCTASLKFRQFYCTFTVIPTYMWCGVLRLVVVLLGGMRAKIHECGASIYGVVLVTVMTIFWFGACVRLRFSPKHRVLWALNYVCTCCVSGTLVSDCYWSVT